MLNKLDAIFMLLMISYELGLFTGIYIFYVLKDKLAKSGESINGK